MIEDNIKIAITMMTVHIKEMLMEYALLFLTYLPKIMPVEYGTNIMKISQPTNGIRIRNDMRAMKRSESTVDLTICFI